MMHFKDLSKKDHKHLRESGIRTLRELREVARKQAETRAQYPDMEPCWDCRRIAREMGLPLTVEADVTA